MLDGKHTSKKSKNTCIGREGEIAKVGQGKKAANARTADACNYFGLLATDGPMSNISVWGFPQT